MARPEDGVLSIEVAYLGADEQVVVRLQLAPGTTIAQAVEQSGLCQRYTELAAAPVGVFGRLRQPQECVEDGDRVEIYRPLIADPKDARRARSRRRRS